MHRAAAEHFFTVRGRGFTGRQWEEILHLAERIVDEAKEAGVKATFTGDARKLEVRPSGKGEPLVVWCKGEPGIPKMIKSETPFDGIVQSILTAIKKVAPSVFVMMSSDGRDYRRIFAEEGAWSRMKKYDQAPKTKEEAFLKAMSRRKWHNPKTKRMVEFISLPKTEQTKLRSRWEQEYGDQYAKALGKARHDVEKAEKSVDKLDELQKAQVPEKIEPKKTAMDDQTILKAAIRVARSTTDPSLKRQLLEILREAFPKEASVSQEDNVSAWLRKGGHEEAAMRWTSLEGNAEKKAALLFPEVFKLALRQVVEYSQKNPSSKMASGSKEARMNAALKLAKKWIDEAIKRPGRVHEYLGIPEGETIPMAKINEAIEKVKGTGDKSLLSALELAKRLKGMKKKKAQENGTEHI